ncbi:winged helix-turn-helix domain-containing protein [Micromonospora endolithica]|uniref:ArsR family transcriptional regulator n=1 Tax=Micromonospora endolithica TaxID=230091 RepID=A0A3A9ZNK7_9ACTN|nr:helix-turn-helix domain-containing protein [Micromonospora endolithica]RKN49116.1 ArsR family transcriptional regulator [Micromonospora endolithica]TWJ23271.1 helix-turn-helix protein [Micromonospora endolithica]
MTEEAPERSTKLTDPRTLRAYAHPLRMRLIGLLRSDGPMTATQAAARLDDNVPNCSFHLRQLAKYGFAERVPGADARERPWRATTQYTSWDDDSDDPAMKAATDQLNSVMLTLFVQRAQDYLAVRGDEPVEWRAAAGFGDALLHVTATELRELTEEVDALLARYDERITDPARRPPGSRPVQIIQMAVPRGPVPPEDQ